MLYLKITCWGNYYYTIGEIRISSFFSTGLDYWVGSYGHFLRIANKAAMAKMAKAAPKKMNKYLGVLFKCNFSAEKFELSAISIELWSASK